MATTSILNSNAVYMKWARAFKRRFWNNYDKAIKEAIGGEFDAFGSLERELLFQYGLQNGNYVIDVGCGSGRLSTALAKKFDGRYLGIDVVSDFLKYARKITPQKSWEFKQSKGLTIPEKEGVADFVCFFSVFTHLRQEETYRYLEESLRVLKRGGKLVFSFLEFRIPSHWAVFEGMLKNLEAPRYLDVFISREMIEIWAFRLGLKIVAIHDGDKPHIPLREPLYIQSQNKTFYDYGHLGQSVAVLTKP